MTLLAERNCWPLLRGDGAQGEDFKRREMDREGLTGVGLLGAAGGPIGDVAPDTVKFIGGGVGGLQLEGFA